MQGTLLELGYSDKKDTLAVLGDAPYFVFPLVLMAWHVFRTWLSQS